MMRVEAVARLRRLTLKLKSTLGRCRSKVLWLRTDRTLRRPPGQARGAPAATFAGAQPFAHLPSGAVLHQLPESASARRCLRNLVSPRRAGSVNLIQLRCAQQMGAPHAPPQLCSRTFWKCIGTRDHVGRRRRGDAGGARVRTWRSRSGGIWGPVWVFLRTPTQTLWGPSRPRQPERAKVPFRGRRRRPTGRGGNRQRDRQQSRRSDPEHD
jgi:hypothetical protein